MQKTGVEGERRGERADGRGSAVLGANLAKLKAFGTRDKKDGELGNHTELSKLGNEGSEEFGFTASHGE